MASDFPPTLLVLIRYAPSYTIRTRDGKYEAGNTFSLSRHGDYEKIGIPIQISVTKLDGNR